LAPFGFLFGNRILSKPAPPPPTNLQLRPGHPQTKRTAQDWPVESFQDWLKDLATIVKNRVQPRLKSIPPFDVTTRPTPAQQHALQLLGASL